MNLLAKSKRHLSFRSRKKINRHEENEIESSMSDDAAPHPDWTPITPESNSKVGLVPFPEGREALHTADTVDWTMKSPEPTTRLQSFSTPVDLDVTIESSSGSGSDTASLEDCNSEKAVLPDGSVRPRRNDTDSMVPQMAAASLDKRVLSDLTSSAYVDCSFESVEEELAKQQQVSLQSFESDGWAVFEDEQSSSEDEPTQKEVSHQSIESLQWAFFVDERSTPFNVPEQPKADSDQIPVQADDSLTKAPVTPEAASEEISAKKKNGVAKPVRADSSSAHAPVTPEAASEQVFVEKNEVLSTPPPDFMNCPSAVLEDHGSSCEGNTADAVVTSFTSEGGTADAVVAENNDSIDKTSETPSEETEQEQEEIIETEGTDESVVSNDESHEEGSIVTSVATAETEVIDRQVIYDDKEHKKGSIITCIAPVSPKQEPPTKEETVKPEFEKLDKMTPAIKKETTKAPPTPTKTKEERLRDMYFKYFSFSAQPPPPKKVLINEDIKIRLFQRTEEEWKVFNAKNKRKSLLKDDQRGYSDPIQADDPPIDAPSFWEEKTKLMEDGFETLSRNVQDALSVNSDNDDAVSVADSLNLCRSSESVANNDRRFMPEFMASFDESAFDASSFKSLDEYRLRWFTCANPEDQANNDEITRDIPMDTPVGGEVYLNQSIDNSVWGSVLTEATTDTGFSAGSVNDENQSKGGEDSANARPRLTTPPGVSAEFFESLQQPILEDSVSGYNQDTNPKEYNAPPPKIGIQRGESRPFVEATKLEKGRNSTGSPTSILDLERSFDNNPECLSPDEFEALLRERKDKLNKNVI